MWRSLCQGEIKVDGSRIKEIQKVPIPTNVKALVVFLQNVSSLEMFIHMLILLLRLE